MNRILVSLVAILLLACWLEHLRPITGSLYAAAAREYQAQRYERSLELLRIARDLDSNDSGILALMGWNSLKQGDAAAATSEFRRAARLQRNNSDLLLGWAYAEMALGRYASAESKLLEVARAGDSAALHIARAALYRHRSESSQAIQEFQKALQLDPFNGEAQRGLAELLASQDLARRDPGAR